MMIVHGLPACDACRAALKALRAAGHGARLRDLRADPLTTAEIARLLDSFGDRIVNRASTTWRGLDEASRALPPARLLALYPALMKRPVIEAGGRIYLGFGPEVRASLGL